MMAFIKKIWSSRYLKVIWSIPTVFPVGSKKNVSGGGHKLGQEKWSILRVTIKSLDFKADARRDGSRQVGLKRINFYNISNFGGQEQPTDFGTTSIVAEKSKELDIGLRRKKWSDNPCPSQMPPSKRLRRRRPHSRVGR